MHSIWREISLILFSAGMFINGTLFIPQILKIIKTKSSEEISFITFFGFNLIQLATVIHGYFVHDYVLMIGMGYSLITCGMVTVLIPWYQSGKLR